MWAQYLHLLLPKRLGEKICSIQDRPISYSSYPLLDAAHDDDSAKASLFSEHFLPAGLATPTPAAVVSEVVRDISKLKNYHCVPFTVGEFSQAVRALKNTAPGHDSIMNIFFSKASSQCKQELLSLFNTSWTSGFVPDSWKHGIVVPIPKPGKAPEQVTGYRPITLLPCMGKLMERMVLRRLQHTLESRNVFSSFHLGFRKGKSTTDALHLMKNAITLAQHAHEYCLIVYLDIEGALDSVWHDGW